MENREPFQPDPLRDEKNPDLAPGHVTFHQLQRMWEESREPPPGDFQAASSPGETPGPDLPPVSSAGDPASKRSVWGVLGAVMGVLLLVLLLVLVLRM